MSELKLRPPKNPFMRQVLGARGGAGGRGFRSRAHRETNLVVARIRARENHQCEIALAELRQRKLHPQAALVVARSRLAAVPQSTLDPSLDLSARLRLAVGSPQDLQIEPNVSRREPRARIEKLHLNAARMVRLLDSGSHFGSEWAGTKFADHDTMLVLHAPAQRIRAEFSRARELLVIRR